MKEKKLILPHTSITTSTSKDCSFDFRFYNKCDSSESVTEDFF